jgi:hypothetical protein
MKSEQEPLEGFAHNPIHQYQDRWWFWDEVWAHRVGPFETQEKAQEALKDYCDYLDGKQDAT